MSDNPLQKPIFENFRQKETDELLQIWQENKRNEWSDVAFEVIQQILQERGIEIPTQNDPQSQLETEPDEEETEFENQSSSSSQPAFYKPQQLLFFADATSIAAWATLGIHIIIGLWYFFSHSNQYGEALILFSGIIALFSAVITGVFSFFILKAVSYILKLLMEFEFNSRGIK